MKDSFSKVHPILLLGYFFVQIILSALCFHPVLIGISLFFSILYIGIIFGYKKALFWIGITAVYMAVIGAINPFINHQGQTIIGSAFGRSLTLEAAAYGVLTGGMLSSVSLWIYILSKTVDSKQSAFVFGKRFATITLMVFIIVRLFKRYRIKAIEIYNNQKGFYGAKDSFKTGLKSSDCLLTYALENGVDTADSMCARGYGISAPTRYYSYSFNGRDKLWTAVMVLCLAVICHGILMGGCKMYFFPALFMVDIPMLHVYISFGLFCAFPVITYVWSEIKWRSIK